MNKSTAAVNPATLPITTD